MKNQQATQQQLANVNELIAFLDDHIETYDAGYNQIAVDRMRNNYGRIHAQYLAIQQAQEEGIFELTIKSATQTIVLHVDRQIGYNAAQELELDLADQLAKLTKNILHQVKDQLMTRASTHYGENSGLEDYPQTTQIHGLCMPTVQPQQAAVEDSERCPFLPASVAPSRKKSTATSSTAQPA